LRNNPTSCLCLDIGDQVAQSNPHRLGDSYQGVYAGGLFTPLNLTQVNGMQVRFLCKLLLAQLRLLAVTSNCLANEPLMRQACWHGSLRKQEAPSANTLYNLLFSACIPLQFCNHHHHRSVGLLLTQPTLGKRVRGSRLGMVLGREVSLNWTGYEKRICWIDARLRGPSASFCPGAGLCCADKSGSAGQTAPAAAALAGANTFGLGL
jgi:hypothetical protein